VKLGNVKEGPQSNWGARPDALDAMGEKKRRQP
jgi:hypothetical protein